MLGPLQKEASVTDRASSDDGWLRFDGRMACAVLHVNTRRIEGLYYMSKLPGDWAWRDSCRTGRARSAAAGRNPDHSQNHRYCDVFCSSMVLLVSVCQGQAGMSVGVVARCSVGVVYRSAREARNER